MTQIRRCDRAECEEEALFMVGVWNDENDLLTDTADVCGAPHAQEQIHDWLGELADIESAT